MLEQLFLLLNGLAICFGVYLVGSDKNSGWYVASIAETTWLLWTLYAGQWGLVPSALGLLIVNIRGLWLHRAKFRGFVELEASLD